MLMRNLLGATAKTDEEFEKVMRRRGYLCIISGIIGTLTVITALVLATGIAGHHAAFLSGLYSGLGGAVAVNSLIRGIEVKKMLKNHVLLRKKRLELQDERSIQIKQKSMAATGTVLIILAYTGLLAAGFLNMTVFWTIFAVIIIQCVVYLVTWAYYDQKL